MLFGILSFQALREYVTLIPTRRADHRVLFWTFFLVTPLEYVLVGLRWPAFVIVIPVYAFLFRGLMSCAYCLSFAPALLMLQIPGYGPDGKLLLLLVVVDQLGKVLQQRGLEHRRHRAATAIGTALWWLTPFSVPVAAAMSFTIAVVGVAGSLVMSAIKRDRRAKGFGTPVQGRADPRSARFATFRRSGLLQRRSFLLRALNPAGGTLAGVEPSGR